ncbi:MAG: SDH family Clp fold serine proteinase [Alphaproteobacteria bacterium]
MDASWIWLLLLLFVLQPLVAQRWQKLMRANKLALIQKKRNSRVIAIIHRQEAVRFFGFPIARYIDMDDAEDVLRAIRTTPDTKPIDVILHTPGGMAIAALQIARALRSHPGRVTMFVPHFAMSGGTLVSLAAHEIVMSEHAVLGAIDPQINNMPAASIIKVTLEKPIAEIDDQTLIFADLGRKAIDQVRKAIIELIGDRMPAAQATTLAEKLTDGRWTHDYPITADEARSLGLNISTDMPEEILNLLGLFPQPIRRRESVESGPDREEG